MTGTGTASDPYIVSNWTEFCQVKDETKKYIRFADAENKLIDLNEEVPDGYTTTFTVKAKEVDFNGWTIKNLTVRNSGISSVAFEFGGSGDTLLKNGIFDTIKITIGSKLTTNYGYYCGMFENCIITGRCSFTGSDVVIIGSAHQESYKKCSINLEILSSNHVYTCGSIGSRSDQLFDQSAVKLSFICTSTAATGYLMTIMGKFLDSKLIVNFSAPDNSREKSVKTINFAPYKTSSSSTALIYSEFTVCTTTDATAPSKNLIDSDTNPLSADSTAFYTPVTDQQFRGTEYLRSIGFDI